MQAMLRVMIFMVMINLSGCSLFSSVDNNISKYVINTLPKHVPSKKRTNSVLLVLPPETETAYNTVKMAYTTKPYKFGYYSVNQWAETPGQMLHPLMVQTLQKTGHYKAVLFPTITISKYDYILSSRILRLQHNFTHYPATIDMVMRLQLTRTSGNILATQTFKISRPMNQQTPYGGVLAANCAVQTLLDDVAKFCLRYS